MLVADLIFANPGTEGGPLKWVRSRDPAAKALVRSDADIRYIAGLDEAGCIRLDTGLPGPLSTTILQHLNASAAEYRSDILVYTFSRELVAASNSQSTRSTFSVSVEHYEALKRPAIPTGARQYNPPRGVDSQQAEKDLVAALTRRRALDHYSGVSLTNVRHALMSINADMYDASLNRETAYSGFISSIIMPLVGSGVVVIEPGASPGRKIWLAKTQTIGVSPVGGKSLQANAPISAAARESDPDKWRDALKLDQWGPFNNWRKALFESIQLVSKKGIRVTVLPQRAVREAMNSLSPRPEKPPITALESFVAKLLTEPVLLDVHSVAFGFSVEAFDKTVTDVVEGFEEILERRLAIELVRRCTVQATKMQDIAWALHGLRDDDTTDAVTGRFSALHSDKRLAVGSDGGFILM